MGSVNDFHRDDRPSTAQPPPRPGYGPPVHELVRNDLVEIADRRAAWDWSDGLVFGQMDADLAERQAFGLRKYGHPLQAGNGRDARLDAYEEALDMLCYLRQAMAEGSTDLGDDYRTLMRMAVRLRRKTSQSTAGYIRDAP